MLTFVNNDATSRLSNLHFSGKSRLLILLTKSSECFMCELEKLPTKGESILVSHMETFWVQEFLLEIIGLKGSLLYGF